MKLLVVEANDLVSKIYNKIFDEKNYQAEIVKTDYECLEKINENFDYILTSPKNPDSQRQMELEIRKVKPTQEIVSLHSFNSENSTGTQEYQEIIEKPFALLTFVAKLEAKN